MTSGAAVVAVHMAQHEDLGWIGWTVLAVFVLSVLLVEFGLLVAGFRRSDGDDDPGGGGEGGTGRGGDGDAPKPPPPPSSGLEPEWWPEFEREFAAHIRRRTTRIG